ncbi:hypothetical protein [Nonomuraea sp. NPDC049158]|uniref:hypothetical protein n=1 Tax=Nonomuraea sp. NPDC049158 TaxID=3155649 RepID=UPI0033FF9FB3
MFQHPNGRATEPDARNEELYPLFCGDDIDFVIGGLGRMRARVPAVAMRARVREFWRSA